MYESVLIIYRQGGTSKFFFKLPCLGYVVFYLLVQLVYVEAFGVALLYLLKMG
jgi:hypothetical protein